ncbi:hypothetical protein OH687_15710 [Burkholderia anthina]|nr:hypothetical protein OH687_15710 [Burkholderia anthina]
MMFGLDADRIDESDGQTVGVPVTISNTRHGATVLRRGNK